jgi:hypothetical protein
MKYSISDVFISINECDLITVGKVLGAENDPHSLEATEIITNSEFEKRIRSFDCAYAILDDCVFHLVGHLYTKDFVGKKSKNNSIDTKWINELKLMGYDINKLDYTLKED